MPRNNVFKAELAKPDHAPKPEAMELSQAIYIRVPARIKRRFDRIAFEAEVKKQDLFVMMLEAYAQQIGER